MTASVASPGLPVSHALEFIRRADLPDAPPVPEGLEGLEGAADDAFLDPAKDQAAAVGAGVVSFMQGLQPERRSAIAQALLLAQLVANKRTPDRDRIDDWYRAYFDVLANLGWIMLFNRDQESTRAARFQVALAADDGAAGCTLKLMAFVLEASTSVTQVVFFRVRLSDATLRNLSTTIAIDAAMLAALQPEVQTRVAAYQKVYIRTLPVLQETVPCMPMSNRCRAACSTA